jgi:hypothetical protein
MRRCSGVAGLVLFLLVALPLEARNTPLPVAPQDRLLVLPVEFAYFRYGPGMDLQVTPERSGNAQRNLEASLQRALQRDESQQFVTLPQLSADELAIVSEYTGLLRLVADTENTAIIEKGWRTSGSSIGDGLAFLAERAGVNRLIFVSGGRGDPQGGVGLMTSTNVSTPVLPGPAGNRRVLSAMVVDLRSGDVLQNILPDRGFAGEPDTVAGANTWMRALFDIVPDRVRREPWRGSPRTEKPLRHPRPRQGFEVTLPTGWLEGGFGNSAQQCFRRHSYGLENLCVDHKSLGDALLAQGMTPDADPLKVGEVAVSVLKSDPHFADMEVTSITPARVAGLDGFRVELVSRLNLPGVHVRERHLVYGMAGTQGAFLMRFDAPAIYYFDHHLADFEAMRTTFKFMKKRQT